jgi:hypothetical protein
MNTPILRLFAAFWWLLVIGCIGGSYFWIEHVRHDYARDKLQTLVEVIGRIPADCFRGGGPPPPDADPAHCKSDPSGLDPWPYVLKGGAGILAIVLLPLIPLTVIRWIITRHWRFGPRW